MKPTTKMARVVKQLPPVARRAYLSQEQNNPKTRERSHLNETLAVLLRVFRRGKTGLHAPCRRRSVSILFAAGVCFATQQVCTCEMPRF
ncbi:hypothetical protein LY78DRAFT_477625 [Colletotrichum sublineola]|nr:hypothetical protein LY78DRAFT_477625 [Colletotrichum sublineola]